MWVSDREEEWLSTCVSSFSFSSVSSGERGSASSILACSSFWTCAEFGMSGLRGTYNKHTYTIAHHCISDTTANTWADLTQILKTNVMCMTCSPCIQWFSCSKESPSPAAQRDAVERIESPGCWAALEAEEPGSHTHTHTHFSWSFHRHLCVYCHANICVIFDVYCIMTKHCYASGRCSFI